MLTWQTDRRGEERPCIRVSSCDRRGEVWGKRVNPPPSWGPFLGTWAWPWRSALSSCYFLKQSPPCCSSQGSHKAVPELAHHYSTLLLCACGALSASVFMLVLPLRCLCNARTCQFKYLRRVCVWKMCEMWACGTRFTSPSFHIYLESQSRRGFAWITEE